MYDDECVLDVCLGPVVITNTSERMFYFNNILHKVIINKVSSIEMQPATNDVIEVNFSSNVIIQVITVMNQIFTIIS